MNSGILNIFSMCGQERLLRNAVEVGNTVDAVFYSVGTARSSLGIRCKISCGKLGSVNLNLLLFLLFFKVLVVDYVFFTLLLKEAEFPNDVHGSRLT